MKKLIIGLIVLGLIIFIGVPLGFKAFASTQDYPPLNTGQPSVIYGSDGKVIGNLKPTETGKALKGDEIPDLVRHAHLAAEDRGFYDHEAISMWGLARAGVSSARAGAFVQGGSTITQQYVKNAYLSQEKSLDRKFWEAVYSYKLEGDYTKQDILDMYINNNYYGRGAYGIEDASMVWFGHSATELSDVNDPMDVAKAAFLASLLTKPSAFSTPIPGGSANQLKLMDELMGRVEYTLSGLREIDKVDPAKFVPEPVVAEAKTIAQQKRIPLTNKVERTAESNDTDPYLLAFIKDWLTAYQAQIAKEVNESLTDEQAAAEGDKVAQAMLARGGLQIHTSIDPSLQALTVQAVREQGIEENGLSVGGVIINPKTGGVAAMYGGNSPQGGFNNALYGSLQVGSTMKPFVLLDAVQKGISVQSEFAAPASIVIDGSTIRNHDRQPANNCRMTLADAMAYSNNPVHIELITGKMASCENPAELTDIGPNWPVSPASVAELARKMGSDDSLVPGKQSPVEFPEVPTLALGVNSMSALKLGVMASTLANNGKHIKPHIITKIVGSDGETIFEHQEESEQAVDAGHAQIVNKVLTGVFEKGTARKARVEGHPLAGKTGTMPRVGDVPGVAWTFAFSPVEADKSYVCSMSAGYNDPSQAGDDPSSAAVARICGKFFEGALNGTPTVDFPEVDLNAGEKVGLTADQPQAPPPAEVTTEEPVPTSETTTEETPTSATTETPTESTEVPSSVVEPPLVSGTVPVPE